MISCSVTKSSKKSINTKATENYVYVTINKDSFLTRKEFLPINDYCFRHCDTLFNSIVLDDNRMESGTSVRLIEKRGLNEIDLVNLSEGNFNLSYKFYVDSNGITLVGRITQTDLILTEAEKFELEKAILFTRSTEDKSGNCLKCVEIVINCVRK